MEALTGFNILNKLGTALDVASVLTTGRAANPVVEATAAKFHEYLDPTLVEMEQVSKVLEELDVGRAVENKIHELTNVQYFEEDAIRTAMGLAGYLPGDSRLNIIGSALVGKGFANDIANLDVRTHEEL